MRRLLLVLLDTDTVAVSQDPLLPCRVEQVDGGKDPGFRKQGGIGNILLQIVHTAFREKGLVLETEHLHLGRFAVP